MTAVLHDVAYAAERLSLSESTVYALVKRKQIGCVRPGTGRGVIRFADSDIDAYLASRRSVPVTHTPIAVPSAAVRELDLPGADLFDNAGGRR